MRSEGNGMNATAPFMAGWDSLRHGGLLLDPPRLARVAAHVAAPLPDAHVRELRRLAGTQGEDAHETGPFVAFVLETVCGLTPARGEWKRGAQTGAEWGRTTVTGETAKPRHLFLAGGRPVLPVFIDREARIGIGKGRKPVSLALQWLRAGQERLALVTNGRQWRLVYAGMDADAWCEGDTDLWFEEGGLSPQVTALRTLLSPALLLPPAADKPSLLLSEILDSRKGQAELSAALGERVREAVEILVQAHGEVLKERCADVDPADIYRAAVRVVMRIVVAFFAESRELLPRDNPRFHESYGLTGLMEELEKTAGRGRSRLARSWSAWPRVLSLFRLVHAGSHHPELTVPKYGGELFAAGDPASADGLTRALDVFETACHERDTLSDLGMHEMLKLVTRTRMKIRQGRTHTWVTTPVDFSDLSSEYIGILYEGLLDFELKTAPADDPVVFLAVGNQPALPLSRLEGMDEKAVANLFEKLKASKKGDEAGEGGEEEAGEEEPALDDADAIAAEGEDDAAEDAACEAEEAVEIEPDDRRHTMRSRAEAWASKAVVAAGLVKRRKGALTPEKRLAQETAIEREAKRLVVRVVLPGEWYVVRWGGTRKGAGTYYTRPGLALPTVARTLRPLAFDPPLGADGKPDPDALAARWKPKRPEEILALKVCDPACGSGTFPVAALRFLTDALYASLHAHGRVKDAGDRSLVHLLGEVNRDFQGSATLARGTGGSSPEALLGSEMLPCRPDHETFEPRLKAILRRHVAERCIHGVDLDPLAVELCRLSLWIETMDRALPFTFLDHKVKCGNGLVGAWFDTFRHYPAMAWKNREGGDKGHKHGVHFKEGARGEALKAFVKERLTPDLRDAIVGQGGLMRAEALDVEAVHAKALAMLKGLHDLPVHETMRRAEGYRAWLDSAEHRALKSAMDLWCACWFWPAETLAHAPMPSEFATPSEVTWQEAARISARKRFFHWELEFPDVFGRSDSPASPSPHSPSPCSGFDAILGNPPWNVAKPNSKEFFSNRDPLYRTYGKQEALRYQAEYFADETFEREWLDYNADFRSLSQFMSWVAHPFGDPKGTEENSGRFSLARGRDNEDLHRRWRDARAKSKGVADPDHPFRHQGSADINLYKTFLEQAHALLRTGGRLGFIVPSGLYSDHGTGALRTLFLDRCRWEWLFGFENRDGIFDIHRSFKFNPIVIEKGGTTAAIRTAFMRRKLEDWESAERFATPYTRAQIDRFSPKSKAILEIQSKRDLEILEKIYANSVLLGDDGPDGWGIKFATEFHMTNDSHLFPPRPKWEEKGYRPDEYSRWLKGNWRPIAELWSEMSVKPLPTGEHRCARNPYNSLPIPRADIPKGVILSREADYWLHEETIASNERVRSLNESHAGNNLTPAIALPLYEGRMIDLFSPSLRGWVSGTGRSAIWKNIELVQPIIEPQFLVDIANTNQHYDGIRLIYQEVTVATVKRTTISTVIPPFPAGNKVPIMIDADADPNTSLALLAVLGSFAFDSVARCRLVGMTMNLFIINELAIPIRGTWELSVARNTAKIALLGPIFSPVMLRLYKSNSYQERLTIFAYTHYERLRIRAQLDAISCVLFDLNYTDCEWLLRDCAHYEINRVIKYDPKGFWRVDKEKDPELRHTVLTLVAFHDLEEKIKAAGGDREKGIEAFLNQNDGEGWMIPETLRLADYGLGHDERAKVHQPVRSRLGPRFYDWQLAQAPEESWRECHLHTRNLLGEAGYRQLLADIEAERSGGIPATGNAKNPDKMLKPSQATLFE